MVFLPDISLFSYSVANATQRKKKLHMEQKSLFLASIKNAG